MSTPQGFIESRTLRYQLNCLAHPIQRLGEGVLSVFKGSADHQEYQAIAIDVFKARNLPAIRSLKKLLVALPSPSNIRSVLLRAIDQLAEQDLETCHWVLQHRHYLEPELNLMHIAQQMALKQLQNRGFVLDQDFRFSSEGTLEASDAIKTQLIANVVGSDRILLEVIFQIHSF